MIEWQIMIRSLKINYDNKSDISLDVNDLTTLEFWCLCEFCELGCCCDENPIIFELLALLFINEFEAINEFIGILELLELEVDSEESNADKSGLICWFCWLGGCWFCHTGLHWGCWGCWSCGCAKLLKLWLRFGCGGI